MTVPKIVFLGRVVGTHGVPRDLESQVLRVLFFNPGSDSLKNQTHVWVRALSDQVPTSEDKSQLGFRQVPLVSMPAPWGAKWGASRGALLEFSSAECPKIGDWVGIERDKLGAPTEKKYFFVHDVLGALVFFVDSPKNLPVGQVEECLDPLETTGLLLGSEPRVVVFRARTYPEFTAELGPFFEFPSAWITDRQEAHLVVEGFAALKENFQTPGSPELSEDQRSSGGTKKLAKKTRSSTEKKRYPRKSRSRITKK